MPVVAQVFYSFVTLPDKKLKRMGALLFISGQEILFIMVIALLLFGADKLPEIARGMGKGIKDIRKATDEIKREFEESTKEVRKDIQDVTEHLQNDINDVTGSVQKDVNDISSSFTEQINDAAKDLNNEVK